MTELAAVGSAEVPHPHCLFHDGGGLFCGTSRVLLSRTVFRSNNEPNFFQYNKMTFRLMVMVGKSHAGSGEGYVGMLTGVISLVDHNFVISGWQMHTFNQKRHHRFNSVDNTENLEQIMSGDE